MSTAYGRHAQLAWWQYLMRDLRTLVRTVHPGSVVAVLVAAVLLGAVTALLIAS